MNERTKQSLTSLLFIYLLIRIAIVGFSCSIYTYIYKLHPKMSRFTFCLLTVLVAACSAFAPTSVLDTATRQAASTASPFALNAVEDYDSETYWEAEYPPSKVLGPLMSKMPSGMLAALSVVFLTSLVVSISGSAALQQEPGAFENGSWVKWYYVLGSFGGPLAWGTHVAAWIQRKNGM